MTGYLHGTNVIVGYVAPVDPTFVDFNTPASIQNEMNTVLREAQVLDADIKAFSGDSAFAAFKSGWDSFFAEYKKFYADNATGVSGWLSRLWASVLKQTIAYGNKLNDFRIAFSKFPGARPSEPDVTAIQRRDDPSAVPWRKILLGAVIVAGIGAGGYALSKVSGVRQEFAR